MDLELLALLALPVLRGVWLLIGYISGNAFPQPLSEKEEAEMIRRLKAGDPMAREVLIERNLRLVAHVVKKFNTNEETDDLISIGTVGLIKGIDTYDPAKGTRLATYTARCIENEILMFLRSRKRVRSEVSLYDPIGVDREGNEIALVDVLGSEPDLVPDRVATLVEFDDLVRHIKELAGKERQVIELRYGLRGPRRTQREIARMLGISRSYVSRIDMQGTAGTNGRAAGRQGREEGVAAGANL